MHHIRHVSGSEGQLTEDGAATPDVAELVDGVQLPIFIPWIVDQRETFCSLSQFSTSASTTNRWKAHWTVTGECAVKFGWRALPLAILVLLIVILPLEGCIRAWRHAECCGQH